MPRNCNLFFLDAMPCYWQTPKQMADNLMSALEAFRLTKDILAQSNAPHQVVLALMSFYESLIATHTPVPAQEESNDVEGKLAS